ncbi:hypothetical protein [Nibricoccus sp. IMCC34717]|uniref:hypothetical protein n=1 Tax=Nibricoccus sp. IMCC34717 TaxID=3034021 RepID=UPI00384BC666
MAYWGDSFINGFNAGQGMRERKQRREQEENDKIVKTQEARAERDLRLKLAADGMRHEGEMLDKRLSAEAKRLSEGYNARAEEGEKDRLFAENSHRMDNLSRGLGLKPQVLPPQGEGAARPSSLITDKLKEGLGRLKQTIQNGFAPSDPIAEVAVPYGEDGSGSVRAKVPLSQVPGFGAKLKPAAEKPPFGAGAEGETVIGPDGKTYKIKNGQPFSLQ